MRQVQIPLALRFCAFIVLVAFVSVLMDGREPARAAFPGGNGKIAFQTERDGNKEIYVMNPDGSGLTNLTNNPDCCDQAAKWSADGSKVAFQRGGSGTLESVFVMNADGSGQTSVKRGFEPAWSPDGSQIAFHIGGIFVMNADGTGQTKLTSTAGDAHAAWSPDGSRIAFDRAAEVYVVNSDGSGLMNLTNSPGGDSTPNWSPKGSQIAFHSSRDGNNEIYVMNADGNGQTRLTNNAARDEVPAWSPDGTKIAFTSERDGNREIYVMNADGSGQTRLTNNPAVDEGPDWQPLAPFVKVGGLAVDLDGDLGDLPLETGSSPGPSTGLAAVAIIATTALAVTGAAWYARRRWAR